MSKVFYLIVLLFLTSSCYTRVIQINLQGEYREKHALLRNSCVALSSDSIKVKYFFPDNYCLTVKYFSSLQRIIPELYNKMGTRISYYEQYFNSESCIGLFYLDYRKFISKNELRITSVPCIKLEDTIIVNFESENYVFDKEKVFGNLENHFDHHTANDIMEKFVIGKTEYVRNNRIIDERTF